MFNISEQLKNLPQKPGVYLMKDANGDIIYVGKAINLKNRVSQYFRESKSHTPKVKTMVSKISEFEYIITDSELEALILECNLIKKYRPKYNVLLKDDKHYPYIKITMNEDYPRILVVRKKEDDGSKYFGPYSGMFFVNDTLEIIKKVFPIRTCNKNLPKDIKKSRPCLNYHIKKCMAPCQGEVNREDYKDMMKEICMFLDGKHQELIKNLEEQMYQGSKNLQFEKAAAIRDKINSINHILERQKIISATTKDQDIIAFASDQENGAVQVFFIRSGKLIGSQKFRLDGTDGISRDEILHQFINQFYLNADFVPREILLQEEIAQVNIIENWLSSKRGSKVHIRVPKKGDSSNLVDLAYRNALEVLGRYNKDDDNHLEELKEFLGLEEVPDRIEAYDISNISGSHSVGVRIVFVNGRAYKKDYRRYKIKSVQGINDYQSIGEVLFRRFKNDDIKPDLICIDGGKGHVNTVLDILSEQSIDIPVCGMVKDDKHKTRGLFYNNKEYDLKQNKALFKLITNIQDEVHRFAIEYHRRLRQNELKTSILDQIDGIGNLRKTELLKYFKSIDNIKRANVEELCKVKSMNKIAAEKVYRFFH